MKPIFKSYFAALVTLLIAALIIISQPNEPVVSHDKQCKLDQLLVCHFALSSDQTQQVIVKFAEKVQVEEQNLLQLTLPSDYILDKAWVQGVNMYMGQVAVFNDSQATLTSDNSSQQSLQFFLGACSEPDMRWQMVLAIKKVSSQKPETFFINFSTELS